MKNLQSAICALTLGLVHAVGLAQGEQPASTRGKSKAQESPPMSRLMQQAAYRSHENVEMIGGKEAYIQDNPWQVALVRGKVLEPARMLKCGGSLIAPRWVVTAAHCVGLHPSAGDTDVIAGASVFTDLKRGRRIHVDQVFVNAWNPTTHENDIALLKLKEDVTAVAFIQLSPPPADAPSDSVTVTGWGRTTPGGDISEQLLEIQIPVVKPTTCKVSYPDIPATGMFCAGLADGAKDSCQGDSGGPATAVSGGSRTLVGIVSWGDGCAVPGKYGVYTLVAPQRPWIVSVMKAH